MIHFQKWLGMLSGAAMVGAVAIADAGALDHWAFQPMGNPVPPASRAAAGEDASAVDAFLPTPSSASQPPARAMADGHLLIRRLSFGLLGLPPTPEAVEAFVTDPDPAAFARLVERYLASPHYGERWGRWWLDIARYADTNGQDENKVMANAWRYRDWVIRSFNANQPLDRFITEQLAGDLLPTEGAAESEVFDRWIATGFLVLGPKMLAEQDKPKLVLDVVDEQVDVVGRAFLGLTVSCARCHDHKYDPIPARDYHALAGIFRSTRTMENLEFVSKFNERVVATREEREAAEVHARALAAAAESWTNALRRAGATLQGRWREELALALADPQPVVRPAPSPLLERLATLQAADASGHHEIRHLQSLAADPGGPAAALEALEADATLDGGLRLAPGRVGRGFHASGRNGFEVPHEARLDPEHLTLETWVRAPDFPDGGDTRRWLVNKNGNEWEEGHYALVLDRNRPGAYLNIGGGRDHVAAVWSEGPVLEPDRWHHVAFTHDGAVLRLFVDGASAGETRVDLQRTAGNKPLAFGRRQDGYIAFRGVLDGIRLYDRALAPDAMAAAAADPGAAPAPGLVATWDFDGMSDAELQVAHRGALRDAVFGPDGLLAPPADPRPWLSAADREVLDRIAAERDRLKALAPPPPARALAVSEDTPTDLPIFARGNHLTPGSEPVSRGFLQVAHRPGAASPPPDRSGRLELARWLTDPEHPLTARVLANRVWQAHFGEGLVPSSDNFGRRGDVPEHPGLLDWLARELIRSGWDLKHLHRLIVNSATWRQAPARGTPASAAGPASGFPRQRLEAEMVRDALLAVSGRLDLTMGGTLVSWVNDAYVPADTVSETALRRTVYLPVVRDRVYDVLTLFDFANPSVGTARRTATVVASQALFFMNSPLVRDCARGLAEQLVASETADEACVREAYLRLYARPPSLGEVARALHFLKEAAQWTGAEPDPSAGWAALCQSLMAANEFLHFE